MTGKFLTGAFFGGAVLWPMLVEQSILGFYTACALVTFLIFVALYVSSDMVNYFSGIGIVRRAMTESIPLLGVLFLLPVLAFVMILSFMFAIIGVLGRNRESAQLRWAMLIDWFNSGVAQPA